MNKEQQLQLTTMALMTH